MILLLQLDVESAFIKSALPKLVIMGIVGHVFGSSESRGKYRKKFATNHPTTTPKAGNAQSEKTL